MKNSKISFVVLMALFTGATMMSSAQGGSVNIEDYFPGPNLMKIVLAENNGLKLSETQLNLFTEWGKEHQSIVAAKNKRIADLEKEGKSLSQKGAPDDEILKKVDETNNLRLEVASTKLSCRDLLRDNLKSKQWKMLVSKYRKDHPFNERKKMMEVIQHVNPVPNYMSVINANISELDISQEQKKITDAWSTQNHPEIMKMANQIISLEADIYNKSLKNTSKEIIYKNFEEINKIRTQIVERKTKCRNLVKQTLSDDQWTELVAKTM